MPLPVSSRTAAHRGAEDSMNAEVAISSGIVGLVPLRCVATIGELAQDVSAARWPCRVGKRGEGFGCCVAINKLALSAVLTYRICSVECLTVLRSFRPKSDLLGTPPQEK